MVLSVGALSDFIISLINSSSSISLIYVLTTLGISFDRTIGCLLSSFGTGSDFLTTTPVLLWEWTAIIPYDVDVLVVGMLAKRPVVLATTAGVYFRGWGGSDGGETGSIIDD
jgi:hypothetical protein